MLKKIWTFGKKNVKKNFDVSAWTNAQGLSDSTLWLYSLGKTVFSTSKNIQKEQFEAAMIRQGLSEKDLTERRQFFQQLFLLYMVCFFSMLAYGRFYIFKLTHNYFILLAVYIVSLLLLAQAFRYSYWTCQIIKRKLGCSVKEWFFWLIRIRS